MAWSAQGDRIAYDKAGEDGLYDVYTAKADGSDEHCVTCNVPELRNRNVLNPDWAPAGDWLAFQVQTLAKKLDQGPLELATPLRAAHSELWVAPPEGRRAWQITRQNERGGSPIDPHFAYEGGRILWSERVAAEPRPWGTWVVRVAELSFKRGTPILGKVRTYEPEDRPGLVLAQGFTPDDRGFLYGSGSLDAGLELYRRQLGTKTSEPLAAGVSGEALRPVPGRPMWTVASGLGLPRSSRSGRLPRCRDVWLVGDETRERLTYFNHSGFDRPGSDHAAGEALIDDLAWSPNGDRFLVHLVTSGGSETTPGAPTVTEGIWLVVMDPSYRR